MTELNSAHPTPTLGPILPGMVKIIPSNAGWRDEARERKKAKLPSDEQTEPSRGSHHQLTACRCALRRMMALV